MDVCAGGSISVGATSITFTNHHNVGWKITSCEFPAFPPIHPERRVACRSRFLDNGSGSSSMLAETDCHRKYRNTSLWVRFQDSGVIRANARTNAPRIAYAHFFSKWLPK